MAFENGSGDLILGDPNGAHIELLSDQAKIVLYNEFGTAIMEFDGSSEFFGETFSHIRIANKEGLSRLQLDQFQVALSGNNDARIRLAAGGLPDQHPNIEFHTQPIADHFQFDGFIQGEHMPDPDFGAKLIIKSPTFDAHSPMIVELESQRTGVFIPRMRVLGDLHVLGFNSLVDGTLTVTGTLTPTGGIDIPWQSYTPTVTASGGGFALGNGTAVGKYQDLGNTVAFELKITLGTTTAIGAGTSYEFSLPTLRDNTGPDSLFDALLLDSSLSTPGYRTSTGMSFTPTGFAIITHEGTTGKFIGPTQPWTWAAGDIIRASGSYPKG